MKRYFLITAAMIAFFLITFFIVEALHIPILTEPWLMMKRASAVAALLGVGLLIADVVLPVPSSLIMVAHGALFGAFVGTILSLIGSLGAALLGFAIGRRGGRLLERLVSAEERERVNKMLVKWGALAIVATRPLPVLAETVAILAGASPISLKKLVLASLVGSLPPALLYALTGALAASFQNTALMFVVVLLVTGCFWLTSRWVDNSGTSDGLA
jgi:uncharacterized membrane protein YdjX (TVP38/TMEM64 family)